MENEKRKVENNYKFLFLIFVLTVAASSVSVLSLELEHQIIFQNLLYFPIIFACLCFLWRGFTFSVILSLGYLATMLVLVRDPLVLEYTLIRVFLFISTAWFIAYISSGREAMKKGGEASELKYKSLFLSSHDAIMTLEPPTWKFTVANPATLKLFMIEKESEFVAVDPWQLSPEKQPDGRLSSEKAKEMIDNAMRDGSNFFEWTHKKTNGEEFAASVLLTRVEIGEKKFLQATVRDITEQKKAEEIRKNNEVTNKLNAFMVNRELKMIDLKGEINALKSKLEKCSKKEGN